MSRATKRYLREFSMTMIVYVIVVIASGLTLNNIEDTTWRIVIALLPMVPVIFLIVVFMRYLAVIDELLQKVQLQAIGFAAGTTGLLTFAYGFLEQVGFPQFSTLLIFPMMILLWGIGLFYFSRRYQ